MRVASVFKVADMALRRQVARPDGAACGEARATSTGNLCRGSSRRDIHCAYGFLISANPIDGLRFAAFAARLAERRSAEEIAPRSPIDAMKPLLRAVGSFPIRCDFCF